MPEKLPPNPARTDQSTHWKQRNPFAFIIARDPLGLGVEGENAVDQERIPMVAVLQFESQEPGAVGHVLHRVRIGVPLIEIAHETD